MNRRTLLMFAFAVIFSVGGTLTLSVFAQQETPEKELSTSEGDPTMPTTGSEATARPPSGAGLMAFAGQPMPFPGNAMTFQNTPMMPPRPEGPIFFGGQPMFSTKAQMPCERGPMGPGRGDAMSQEGLLEYLSTGLELTEEQKAQIEPLLENTFPSPDNQAKDFSGPSRQNDQPQMGQELEAKFKEILTDEQMQKLREMKEPGEDRSSAGPQMPFAEGPMAPPNNQMMEGPMQQGDQPMSFGRVPMAPQGNRRMGPPSFRAQMGPRNGQMPFIGGPMAPPNNQMMEGLMQQSEQPMSFDRAPMAPQGNRRIGPPSFRAQMGPRNGQMPFIGGPMAPPNNQMMEGLMQQSEQPMSFDRAPMAPQGNRRMGPPSFRAQMGPRNGQMPFAGGPMAFRGKSRGLNGEQSMSFDKRKSMNAEKLMKNLSTKLELTEEQQEKVQPLLEEHFLKMREQIETWRGQNRQQFQEGGQKMWLEIETLLKEILTEKQMQKLREMKESRMGPSARFGFFGGPGSFRGSLNDLQLSEEQQQKISTIVENHRDSDPKKVQNFLDMHAAMAEILQQEEFNEQQVRELFQQQTSQWEERFVERAKMLAEIKTVLTPEQINTFQEKGAHVIDMIDHWHGARQ